MGRKHLILGVVIAGLGFSFCSQLMAADDTPTPAPTAEAMGQTITGAATPQAARPIALGTRFRIFLDAGNPLLKKQYFKLHLDGRTPIVQYMKVINSHPHQTAFAGRCTLLAKDDTDHYALSVVKLGGVWNAEGEGGEQLKKVDLFSEADLIFEVLATQGAGYFELLLEKHGETNGRKD